MKQEVKQGQADYSIVILVRDTSGNAKTGLTNASGGIDVSYTRVETDNDVTQTDGAIVALATPALDDPHLDWGFLEIDATNHPGLYRLDIADGAFASGAWSSVVTLIGTGLEPSHCEFVLIPSRPYDGVQLQTTHAAVTFATLSVTGQMDAGNLLIDGTTVLTGTTTLTGAVSLGSTLGITGAVTLSSTLATGAVTLSALTVTNNLLVSGTSTLTGNVTVTGTVGTGAVTLASLVVSGTTTLTGNVTVTGTLGTGAVTFASVAVTGALSVGTTTTLTGNVSLGGTLGVTGITTFTGAVNANITGDITGNLSGTTGEVASVAGDVKGNVDGTVTAVTPADAAAVNAQVLDVLNVDTFAEPGDEAPVSTTTLQDKISYLYKFMRNKIETTATKIHVYDDAGTNKDQTSTISDDATTFTRGEFGIGDV